MRLSIDEVLEATGGRLMNGSGNIVTGVSTDSRTLMPGDLFFALRGEKHDGHDHVGGVFSRGASGVVVDRDVPLLGTTLRVADTLQALGDLAHAWRRRFRIPVVAITGSNGKTTTKDMTAALLAARYRVLKTHGNFNNLIGLPLTIFRMQEGDGVAVLEMGMNRPGEIDRLARIAEPRIGVITNIARAHLAGLGSLSRIARAKAELLAHIPKEGVAVLNADDPYLKKIKVSSRRVTFGRKRLATFRATEEKVLGRTGLGGLSFAVKIRGKKEVFRLPVIGLHNISNALAAIAVADHLGVPPVDMRRALASFQTEKKRMEVLSLPGGIDLINDCYNANPDSMAAALRFFKESSPSGRRRVAILGDMLELGEQSVRWHRELGAQASRQDVNLLFAVGSHAGDILRGIGPKARKKMRTFVFGSVEEAAPVIARSLRSGDIVLIKGSRGMKMERITEILQGQ